MASRPGTRYQTVNRKDHVQVPLQGEQVIVNQLENNTEVVINQLVNMAHTCPSADCNTSINFGTDSEKLRFIR